MLVPAQRMDKLNLWEGASVHRRIFRLLVRLLGNYLCHGLSLALKDLQGAL